MASSIKIIFGLYLAIFVRLSFAVELQPPFVQQLPRNVFDLQHQSALSLSSAASEDAATTRKKAYVRPLAGNLDSYSGYLKVNDKQEAKLFYWFFETKQTPTKKPIVVWLHGDPGRTSLLSVFEENGPYKLVGDDKVEMRKNHWTEEYNVLYLDHLLGVGYSSAKSSSAFSKSCTQAAENLFAALQEFMRIHEAFDKTSVYLAGEAYAAKFHVALAQLIHKKNKDAKKKINLKGLSLGGGVIYPEKQHIRAEYLYQLGAVDPKGKQDISMLEDNARNSVANRKYGKAKSHNDEIDKKIKVAGYDPIVDASVPNYDLSSFGKTLKFLQTKKMREHIHAGDAAKFEDKAKTVLNKIRNDLFYKSCSKELSQLLEWYKVVLYAGQFDLMVPPSQIDKIITALSWDKSDKFMKQDRIIWYNGGKLVGYMKTYDNLYQVMIREANHYIAHCQPVLTMKILSYLG